LEFLIPKILVDPYSWIRKVVLHLSKKHPRRYPCEPIDFGYKLKIEDMNTERECFRRGIRPPAVSDIVIDISSDSGMEISIDISSDSGMEISIEEEEEE